jgi:putative heme iron utilization protein
MRELETVVLTRDFPEYGLSCGDIGVVVHCYKGRTAFEVEFVTGKGETLAVITLESKDVRSMHPNEILHAREIKAA